MIDTYGFATTCIGAFIVHKLLSADLLELFQKVLHLHRHIPHSATHITTDILGGLTYEVVFTIFSIYVSPFDYLHFFYYVIETVTYVALEVTSFVIVLQFIHLILACWRCFKALNFKIRRLLLSLECNLDWDNRRYE